MTKTTKRVLCGLLCLVLCISCVFAGCRQEIPPAAETAPPERVEHTVTVKNTADEGMAGIGVYVYTDETKAELVWFAKTDDRGVITFSDVASDSYVAVLADVPQGYKAEEMYPLTGTETEIVLESGLLSGDDLEGITVGLGDMMFDFTITDTDGNTHTLSQLLQEKDAVVLNFWFMGCEPCKAEFPYLQQAYEKYSDRIAVLALNPIDSDESAVAAYKADMGLTMPVAVVDPQWAQILGLTAYPTTVVIDRFGTVTLMHTGSIPSAEGFEAIFETFVGEDYEQDVVEDPQEIIPVVGTKGSAEEPYEFGGVNSFEVTVEPGKTVYVRIYKAFDMYMQIKSADAMVIVGEKTYKPQDGKVGLSVNCEDTYTPVLLQIGNTGTETKTFKATLTSKSGTVGNPKAMSLGDFTVKVNAGNEQGVYYAYKAEKDGVLTLQCLEGTAGVKYNFALYNLNTYAYRTLDADGEGNALSIKVKKGQNIQFIMFTVPDESFKYPAGTFQMRATLDDNAGGEEEEVVETAAYSVTVKDNAGQPMPGVKLLVKGDTYTGVLTTDEAGVAAVTLPLGAYTATVTVPGGYTAENAVVELTAESLTGEVVLTKVVVTNTDYKVTVLAPDGVTPVENAMVIVGEAMAYTDASGSAVLNLTTGTYNVYLSDLSDDCTTEESYYTFPAGSAELTITLIYIPGTENNPIVIDSNPYTTDKISGGSALWYHGYNVGGMILTIVDENAYVIYNGVTYGADNSGNVVVALEPAMPMAPTALIVGNSGTTREAYTLTFSYPKGHRENPIVLSDIESFTTDLAAGDEDGIFYSWLPEETGTVAFRITGIESETANVTGDISINDGMKVLSADGVTDENGELVLKVEVSAEEKISIQVLIPVDMDTWTVSAGKVTVAGEYIRDDESSEDPTDPSEDPTDPSEDPTDPSEDPTDPSEDPTDPSEDPTDPSEDPTDPSEDPTDPSEPEQTLQITQQPVDSACLAGEQASFTVGVSNAEGVSYRWYLSTDGGDTWSKSTFDTAKTANFSFAFYTSRIGWQVYCEITDAAGNVLTSDVASVLLRTGPLTTEITQQPTNSCSTGNEQITFTVGLSNTEGVKYQWYQSTDGGDVWNKCGYPTAQSATLSIGFYENRVGWQFYCQITDANGNILTSDVAEVTRVTTITQQPQNSNTASSEKVTFTVAVADPEGVSYQWYLSKDSGVSWSKCTYSTAKDATLSFAFYEDRVGWQVYCQITDVRGNVLTSDVATVTQAVEITKQPGDVKPIIGLKVSFTVGVSNTEGVSYQWYLSKDSGASWSKSGETTAQTATLEFMATEECVGWQVRCEVTDATGRVLTTNAATVLEPDREADYVITVEDYAGNPVASTRVAVYDAGGSLKKTLTTNANGQATVTLERANYTVKLLQVTAYYEQSTAVLTAIDTELTIRLAQETTSGDITESWYSDSEQVYAVTVGGTHVQYGSGQVGYSTEHGVTFFYFTAQEAGVYRFATSSADAQISYWNTSNYPFNSTSDLDSYADNSFTLSVKEDQVGNVTYVIGISGSGECALIITREGDVELTLEDMPYTVYTGTTTPTAYTYTGGTLTYVDYTGATADYKLVFNEEEGVYHLGTANGPVLYANLLSGPFISLDKMINGDGFGGGTGFKAVFQDSNGAYVKEDYTELMQKYIACADATAGVYPVNEDLMYMLRKGIEYRKWTDSSSANYLFKDNEGNLLENVNPEIAWMFLFCYEAAQ